MRSTLFALSSLFVAIIAHAEEPAPRTEHSVLVRSRVTLARFFPKYDAHILPVDARAQDKAKACEALIDAKLSEFGVAEMLLRQNAYADPTLPAEIDPCVLVTLADGERPFASALSHFAHRDDVQIHTSDKKVAFRLKARMIYDRKVGPYALVDLDTVSWPNDWGAAPTIQTLRLHPDQPPRWMENPERKDDPLGFYLLSSMALDNQRMTMGLAVYQEGHEPAAGVRFSFAYRTAEGTVRFELEEARDVAE
jgi:hypothetical protein